MSLSRTLQYLFIAIIVTTVGFSLYQWNASRASTQKTAPNNGLVGYWSFNEGAGTLAGDASVNKNTGTLTNGPTWVSGKLGQAVNFDGTNDHITMGDPTALKLAGAFTISAWIYPESFGGNSRGRIVDKNSGFIAGYLLDLDNFNTTNGINVSVNDGFAATSRSRTFSNAVTLNKWQHIIALFDGTNLTVYNNGVSVGASQTLTVPTSGTNNFVIGGRTTDNARNFDGYIDEVRIYNRALSGTEVTNLYNLGAEKLNVSPVSNLTSGLVGYWTFDGKDTPWSSSSAGTATDRSGNSNTGTLTNMSQSTSVLRGQLGQALNFDGTDDYTTTTDSATLDALDTADLTLTGWFYRNTATTDDTIIAKRNGIANTDDGYILYIDDSTDKLTFEVSENSGTDEYRLESTTTFTTPGWYHYTIVWDQDSAGNSEIYINGVTNGATDTGTIGNIGDLSNALSFNIGSESDGGNPFDGRLDETRVYNRTLSSTEIQSLYDLGASDKVNSSVSQNQGTGRLDSGLVGYWKLDDGSGTTATDSSVNGNTATLYNSPTWITGQNGGAVSFNGTTQYATMGQTITAFPASVSYWVKPTAATAGIQFMIYYSASVYMNGGFFDANYYYSARTDLRTVPVSRFNIGQWNHVVQVQRSLTDNIIYVNGVRIIPSGANGGWGAGNISSIARRVGGASDRYFDGSIDEFRVYNRALSDDEASELYRLTTPTGVDTSLKGYWSFDGKATNWTSSSAGTVSDLSGSGNTGTMTNMSQSTSIIPGKLGQALDFDGTDDYTTTPDSSTLDITDSTNFTLTGWFNRNTFTTDDTIIGKSNGQASSDTGYNIYIDDSTDKLTIVGNDGTDQYKMESVSTFTATDWHHFALVWDDSSSANTKLYIDGVSEAATTTGTFANVNSLANALTFRIGAESDNGNPFDGKIDEVRIYNRVLSDTEVAALYNSAR